MSLKASELPIDTPGRGLVLQLQQSHTKTGTLARLRFQDAMIFALAAHIETLEQRIVVLEETTKRRIFG